MTTIFQIIISIFVVALTISTIKGLWTEMIIPCYNEEKENFLNWYHSTRIGRWHWNHKQGVKILTEKEYNKISKGNKIIVL